MKSATWRVALIAALLWSIGAEMGAIISGADFNPWIDLAVGQAYMTAGFVLWARDPANRMGRLLTAAGFAWFAGNYGSGHPVLVSFGTAFSGAAVPIVMHAVFAYPSGRLTRGIERALIAVGYGIVLGGALLVVLFVDRACEGCPRGIALFPIAGAEAWVPRANVGYLAFSLASLALLVKRFLDATPARRLGLTELWVAGFTEAILVAITATRFVLDRPFSLGIWTALSAAKILIPVSLLVGSFRIELARASVAGLVVELDPRAEPGDIRGALRRALHDPSLEIAYWIADRNCFVDAQGRQVALPQEGGSVTMIERGGQRLAALLHDAALLDKRDLVRSAGAATALALENARLHAEIKLQLEEVRASRARIVEAADAERIRIERNLHDGAQQRLLTMAMSLREAQRTTTDPSAAAPIDAALEDLDMAMAELREFARGVYPAILTEEGLGPALESLAERASTPAVVRLELSRRPPAAIERTAYFVASEALANVTRHAEASEVRISAVLNGGTLVVCIEDDGRGGADVAVGSGLRGLADRVAALGGQLHLESADGAGTRVTAEIPCD